MNVKHSFFSENLTAGILDEIESNHATRVLRLVKGDFIRVIDGKGSEAIAQITQSGKKSVEYTITELNKKEANLPLVHIAIAFPKSNDRLNFFLEKVTEIGVSKISPIISANSERQNFKIDKMRHVLVAALKQSGNLYLPELADPIKIQHFMASQTSENNLFIAHCENDSSKRELKNVYKSDKTATILIGPEGDFSPEEVILAKEKGFVAVSLGESRLRTETAGIVACHTFHVIA